MFVCCDKNGNVLKEPISLSDFILNTSSLEPTKEYYKLYSKAIEEYEKQIIT
jgi:hypothetical protein